MSFSVIAGLHLLCSVTLVYSQTLLSATTAPSNPFGTNVIARGQGVEVRQSQLDDLFIAFKVNRAVIGQPVSEDQRSQFEQGLLEKLIVFQLCNARATDADKATARTRTDKLFAEQVAQAGSPEAFAAQLRTVALTPESLRNQLLEQAIFETVIEREVNPTFQITLQDERAYYTNNPSFFKEPERVRVSHVFISTRDPKSSLPLAPDDIAAKMRVAETIRSQAKAGESFTSLVQTFSDDVASKARNGEYTFARAKDDPAHAMPAIFETAAFALQTNQVSEVVVTSLGLHVIKSLQRFPARTVDFTEAEPAIREKLSGDKIQEALPAFIAKLKQEAGVELLK